MRITWLGLILSLLFTPFTNADPYTVEHIVWKKVPLKITLPLGKERILSFPYHKIGFNYDKVALTEDVLHIDILDGVVYLKALKPFNDERVMVALLDEAGETIIIDLSAKANASTTSLDFLIDEKAKLAAETQIKQKRQSRGQPLDLISFCQFAAQQLYSPKRLLAEPAGVTRVPMRTERIVPLYESVTAMPLVSWRSGDTYITAVLFRNELSVPNKLQWNRIRGHWDKAFFFPLRTLDPAGNRRDTTTLFLISDRPFADII